MILKLATIVILFSCIILTDGLTAIYANETKEHNKNVRPVRNPNDAVVVTASFFLISIEDVNFIKQYVSFRGFYALRWKDVFAHLLKEWDWMNDDQLSLDAELIWLPDLRVGNSEGFGNVLGPKDYGKVIIDGNGAVEGFPYITREIKFVCDVTFYPFDTQEVGISLYSWSLDISKLKLVPNEDFYQTALQIFMENGEWDITKQEPTLKYMYADNRTYASIAYEITIRRKWLHPVLTTIGPIVITSVLNSFVFMLPVESGERITLSISVFIILAVFLTIINESLPKTSNTVSILVIYLSMQIVGTVLTIVTTCAIITVHHKKHHDNKSKFYTLISKLCCLATDNVRVQNVHLGSRLRKSGDESEASCNDDELGKILADRLDTLFFWLSVTWNIVLVVMIVIAINA